MRAIIGLGNPGERYRKTRHNVGFLVVAELDRRSGQGHWEKKFNCSFSKRTLAGEDCLLILPEKYMNLSGEAVVPLLKYFRINSDDVVVVHDELDLAPGIIRCRKGGGAAGHKGVGNIVQHLGSNDFIRVRVGIGRPLESEKRTDHISDWVLSAPTSEEKQILEESISNAADACLVIFESGLAAAQERFHRREKEAPSSEDV